MKQASRRPWHHVLALCALALNAFGCGDVLGPEDMPVADVDGKVSQRGKPVTRGWIEFVPVDGTVGRMRSARIHSDGAFHATKVPVGLNLIRLVNVDVDSPRIRQEFGGFTSRIRRTISLDRNPHLALDVIDEYLKLMQPTSKEVPGQPPAEKRGER